MSIADERDEIRDLIARYTLYVDTGRADEWASLFTDHGELCVTGRSPITGRQALTEFAMAIEPGAQQHVIVNEVIDIDREGEKATCYCSLLLARGQPPTLSMSGRYVDELVRVGGQWKFRRRTLTRDQ